MRELPDYIKMGLNLVLWLIILGVASSVSADGIYVTGEGGEGHGLYITGEMTGSGITLTPGPGSPYWNKDKYVERVDTVWSDYVTLKLTQKQADWFMEWIKEKMAQPDTLAWNDAITLGTDMIEWDIPSIDAACDSAITAPALTR